MQVKTIAFYHYTFPAGGAEVVTCNLGRFFAKHGFRVLLYTWKPNAKLLTEELRKIFDIRPLPDTKRISGTRNTDFLCESLKQSGQTSCSYKQPPTSHSSRSGRAPRPKSFSACTTRHSGRYTT